MARIRTIKPDAFSSDSLCSVPIAARWTFAGLWTFADDDGRCRDEPRLIKAHVYPLDDDVTAGEVKAHLDALDRVGCIRRYEIDGKRFLQIPNFRKHQKINRPSPSKIPGPPWENGEGTPPPHGGLTEDSVSDPGDVREPSPPRARAREVEQGSGSGSGKEAEDARERANAAASSATDDRPAVLATVGVELVDEYARTFRHSIPRDFRAGLLQRVDSLLTEGFTRDQVRAGLIELSKRRKVGPGLLPSLVHDALAGPAPGRRFGPDPNAGIYRRGPDDTDTEFKAEVLSIDEWMKGA